MKKLFHISDELDIDFNQVAYCLRIVECIFKIELKIYLNIYIWYIFKEPKLM